MKATFAVMVLLGLISVEAATVKSQVQLSVESLAQSGVTMDAALGTEVLSESFLQAEAKQEANLISQQESAMNAK